MQKGGSSIERHRARWPAPGRSMWPRPARTPGDPRLGRQWRPVRRTHGSEYRSATRARRSLPDRAETTSTSRGARCSFLGEEAAGRVARRYRLLGDLSMTWITETTGHRARDGRVLHLEAGVLQGRGARAITLVRHVCQHGEQKNAQPTQVLL